MIEQLYEDSRIIIRDAIEGVKPDAAVRKALEELPSQEGKLYLVATGKAAWQMAKVASDILGESIEDGVVVTKYNHVLGDIKNVRCFEAGHPVPDENSFLGTAEALHMVENLTEKDQVLFLLSGGGSALFEKPLIDKEELEEITQNLLSSGADIVEMNTVRKRLSAVKGGRFAKICNPAKVYSVVLSDIVGDPLDMIASGPAYPDKSSTEEALKIIEKYKLNLSDKAKACILEETPKELDNVVTKITGSVRQLCAEAAKACKLLGYEPIILTDQLSCQAREAGAFLGVIGKTHENDNSSKAFIAGGETVVKILGKGKGGRNQELAFAAAKYIAGTDNIAVFSVGSDGTDGPTDAAGGYVDGMSMDALQKSGMSYDDILNNNDAYNGLDKVGGLIITGPTGTNVNDVAVVLIRGKQNYV